MYAYFLKASDAGDISPPIFWIFRQILGRECDINALSRYPHVNVSIRDLSQILTTAPIFLYFNYFRQKYLEIASCAVSLLNNIWVRVEHSLLQQPNLKENQLQFKQFAGMM